MFVFVGVAVAGGIGYFGFSENMFSVNGVLIAVLCALPSVFLAREAVFEVRSSNCMQCFSVVNERLHFYGFERQGYSGNGRVSKYDRALPSLLRWEKSVFDAINRQLAKHVGAGIIRDLSR